MTSIQKLQILLQSVEEEMSKTTKVSKTSARKQLLNISKETQILRRQLLEERKNKPIREKLAKKETTMMNVVPPTPPNTKKSTRRKKIIEEELPAEHPQLIRS